MVPATGDYILKPYVKFLLPFVSGLAVVVLGVVLHDAELRSIGVGAVAASLATFAVPNSPPIPPPEHFEDKETHPEESDAPQGKIQLPQ